MNHLHQSHKHVALILAVVFVFLGSVVTLKLKLQM